MFRGTKEESGGAKGARRATVAARTRILVTRPIFPTGGSLVVNLKCHPGGRLQAAIADGQGNVLPGFKRQNCRTLAGDGVRCPLTWRGQSRLPAGRVLKLHFFMQNAERFSFSSWKPLEALITVPEGTREMPLTGTTSPLRTR